MRVGRSPLPRFEPPELKKNLERIDSSRQIAFEDEAKLLRYVDRM